MDYAKFIVSYQKEETISIQRVKLYTNIKDHETNCRIKYTAMRAQNNGLLHFFLCHISSRIRHPSCVRHVGHFYACSARTRTWNQLARCPIYELVPGYFVNSLLVIMTDEFREGSGEHVPCAITPGSRCSLTLSNFQYFSFYEQL